MTTLIFQVVREGQVNRRDVRAAARVIRSEIVRNLSTVETILTFGMVPPTNEVQIRTARLDARIDALAIELPREELGLLLAFLQMSEQASTVVERVRARADHAATPRELDWLANTWMPAAAFCQALLGIRGMRGWEAWLTPREWLRFRRLRSRTLRDGFAAPQLDEFLEKLDPSKHHAR